MRKPSNSYWEKRARQRMASYHRDADPTINIISSAYDKALADITAEIVKIFETYGKNGQLDSKTARKYLNQKIPNPILALAKKWYPRVEDPRIKRWMLNRMNAPAYRARITRLQALREQIYLQSKVIADVEIKASTGRYIKTINKSYYRTMFDIQRGLGIGFEFASMPTKTIEAILKNPWSGEHFSARIWNNTDLLAKNVTELITAGFMSGASNIKITKELEKAMEAGKFAAARLVRTEMTYMSNAGEMESYDEAGIDQYIFVATLDNRTSEDCQSHDRKVYYVKDAMPGKNLPPLHTFCRSTTRAYFGPETLAGIQRRARDPKTGKTYLIPADINYEQWQKSIEEKYGKSRIDTVEKQIQNKVSDMKQFEKYKLIYGKELGAKNFAEFQSLKYNKGEIWLNLKNQKQQVLNTLDYKKSFNGKFGDKEVREWYISHDKNIVNIIDTSRSIKQQAKQAHGLRNKYRTEARLMMSNRELAESLNKNNPNLSFGDTVKDKMNRKDLTQEEAYLDIIATAGKTNKKVNERFKLE